MKFRHIIALLLIVAFSCTLFVACKKEEPTETPTSLVDLSTLTNVPDGQLEIEWLTGSFKNDKPTAIYVHGEMKGCFDKKVSLLLDPDSYITKDNEDASKPYNVDPSSFVEKYENGRNLVGLWKRMGYNFGIFHYEAFADDDLGVLTKKIFSKAEMRYKKSSGEYESNSIPACSLTEVLAARIAEAIPDDATADLRLIGNGIGADLALSATDYLYTCYENDTVTSRNLPTRLAFVDPYLTAERMPNGFNWRTINEEEGLLSMLNDMMEHTTNIGLVAEMIESVEIGSETIEGQGDEEDTVVETHTYAYNTGAFSDKQRAIKNQIIENTAHLTLREQYSASFTATYKAQNRAGVDWYLASVAGSDEVDEDRYTSNSINMGLYDSKPILNDNKRASLSPTSTANNYAVSAWTPSVWTRGLRGIRFVMKKIDSTASTSNKDDHGNTIYKYNDYLLARFRVENYQKATNMDYSMIGGYVFADTNEDKMYNEGIGAGISGITMVGYVSQKVSSGNKKLLEQNIVTESDGFYMFKIDNDSEGNRIKCTTTSTSGDGVVTLDLTAYTPGKQYGFENSGTASSIVIGLVNNHFNINTASVTITRYTVNSLQIKNCALTVSK